MQQQQRIVSVLLVLLHALNAMSQHLLVLNAQKPLDSI